ncbi:hypothetical protein RHSIM_Rhsim13G0205300 [Rhododendron simsii]|uniref:Ankyrin repeat family protein n=1 Tax=Rhododendron simsii TaxID=118357 RepID=A0A834FYY3_RHOSS|nr:hypothetical protein RHSIM_Rhsim13G0205300 [Rhododendron simsii]
MEAPARQQSFRRKKMTKQLTGKRDNTPLHSLARAGNLEVALEIITNTGDDELKELLSKQNQAKNGFDAFHIAAKQKGTWVSSKALSDVEVDEATVVGISASHVLFPNEKRRTWELTYVVMTAVWGLAVRFGTLYYIGTGGGARRARDELGLGPQSENTSEFTEQESGDGDVRDPQQHVDLFGDVISEREVGLKAA